uniref:Ig-like domain-containing protein n=1 Tax=Paramormyrops kingsleyae TaxID=1676925 RepID=A0A3B3SM50_9TELE
MIVITIKKKYIYMCYMMFFTLVPAPESWPPAQLTADPPGSDVLLGEKVTLTCRVTGSEGWKYFWTRETNGAISDLLGSSGQDGETYILQPVMKTDQGLYQCMGQRGHYSFSNYHSLQVHGKLLKEKQSHCTKCIIT